jgi:hypothetical protein
VAAALRVLSAHTHGDTYVQSRQASAHLTSKERGRALCMLGAWPPQCLVRIYTDITTTACAVLAVFTNTFHRAVMQVN